MLGLIPALFAGCGGGGEGGSGSSFVFNPSSVQGVTVNAHPTETRIGFTVVSPQSHPMTVRIEFSEDRGLTYREAETLLSSVHELPSSPQGTRHEILWNPSPDLAKLDQADLRVRVTPRDEVTLIEGGSAASDVFALGVNLLPIVTGVTTPVGIQGGTIPIQYRVQDTNLDHVEIRIEFSVDDGAHWFEGSATEQQDGWQAVSTQSTVAPRTIVWNAQGDVPGFISDNLRIRLTPYDIQAGTPDSTADFSVNLRAPILSLLTIGNIPASMSGSTPYTSSAGSEVHWHYSVPRSGFQILVKYTWEGGGAALDLDRLEVTIDADIDADHPAGTSLGEHFTKEPAKAYWEVSEALQFPTGPLAIRASIRDEHDNVSEVLSIDVNVVSAGNSVRPFSSKDKWWLNFGADYASIESTGGNTVIVTTTTGANGVADFVEDLYIVGLQSNDPTDDAAEIGTNGIIQKLVKAEFIGRLRELYGGDFDGEEDGFHSNLEFTLERGGHNSSIRVGGDDANAGFTIGRAYFDYRNGGANTNDSPTLGVFTTNLISFYINSSGSFKSRFDALIPGRGTPVGEHDLDDDVLGPEFNRFHLGNTTAQNRRYDRIWNGIRGYARSAATVCAHEIGHSIGLCANGLPPTGLFGNVKEPSFSGAYTNPYHFDSPGNNLMAAALSFSPSVNTGVTAYRFNQVNEAYLREWTVLSQ